MALKGQRPLHPQLDSRRDLLTPAPDNAIGHTMESNGLESLERALLEPAAAKDTLRAVCAHITANEGAESSRALAGLVRALYLDASTFTFESLDCLGPVTRRHAEHMISARLWNTWPEEEWQKAFAAVSAYEFKDARSTLVGSRAPSDSRSAASASEGDAGVDIERLDVLAKLGPSGTRRAAGPEAGGRESGSTSREWLARFVVLILFLLMAAAFVLHVS